MNRDLVHLAYTAYRRACEIIYKLVHTQEYVLEVPSFSIKLPMATLRSNLMVLRE